uniref:Uncharacterized protein n=2 Tax=Caenorhabditis japonica TaxID=281687 RepID=A0A8R1IQE9_CAEJA
MHFLIGFATVTIGMLLVMCTKVSEPEEKKKKKEKEKEKESMVVEDSPLQPHSPGSNWNSNSSKSTRDKINGFLVEKDTRERNFKEPVTPESQTTSKEMSKEFLKKGSKEAVKRWSREGSKEGSRDRSRECSKERSKECSKERDKEILKTAKALTEKKKKKNKKKK